MDSDPNPATNADDDRPAPERPRFAALGFPDERHGPLIAAVMLGLISAPIAALSILDAAVPTASGGATLAPLTFLQALAMAVVCVLAAAAVAGSLAGAVVRRRPVLGFAIALFAAWPIAIGVLPLLPAAAGWPYEAARICFLSCSSTLLADMPQSGVIAYAYTLLAELLGPRRSRGGSRLYRDRPGAAPSPWSGEHVRHRDVRHRHLLEHLLGHPPGSPARRDRPCLRVDRLGGAVLDRHRRGRRTGHLGLREAGDPSLRFDALRLLRLRLRLRFRFGLRWLRGRLGDLAEDLGHPGSHQRPLLRGHVAVASQRAGGFAGGQFVIGHGSQKLHLGLVKEHGRAPRAARSPVTRTAARISRGESYGWSSTLNRPNRGKNFTRRLLTPGPAGAGLRGWRLWGGAPSSLRGGACGEARRPASPGGPTGGARTDRWAPVGMTRRTWRDPARWRGLGSVARSRVSRRRLLPRPPPWRRRSRACSRTR